MVVNGLREIRIDMIMNIGRERRDGQRENGAIRQVYKCLTRITSNNKRFSPLLFPSLLAPHLPLVL